MPRSGYTSITAPIELKDRLKETASLLGYSIVPQMLDSWLWERTGTVQVRDRSISQSSMTTEHANISSLFVYSRNITKNGVWCGRRDSNPGRLRGRQMSCMCTMVESRVRGFEVFLVLLSPPENGESRLFTD